MLGGEFGTGTGEEMDSPAESEAGSYRPVWLPLEQLEGTGVGRETDRRGAGPPRPTASGSWTTGSRTPLVVDEV